MSFLTDATVVNTAANAATGLFIFFIGVQLLVAAGILPISIAWGGRRTELTPELRLAGIAAAVILSIFIYIIRSRAGQPDGTAVRIMAWVVTAYMGVNTIGNFASDNNVERLIFGPSAVMLTIACFIVSASG